MLVFLCLHPSKNLEYGSRFSHYIILLQVLRSFLIIVYKQTITFAGKPRSFWPFEQTECIYLTATFSHLRCLCYIFQDDRIGFICPQKLFIANISFNWLLLVTLCSRPIYMVIYQNIDKQSSKIGAFSQTCSTFPYKSNWLISIE